MIIWNDETHTFDYVIELLMDLFGHAYEQAYKITDTVHHAGRGIALTTHKELAELKREQILGAARIGGWSSPRNLSPRLSRWNSGKMANDE